MMGRNSGRKASMRMVRGGDAFRRQSFYALQGHKIIARGQRPRKTHPQPGPTLKGSNLSALTPNLRSRGPKGCDPFRVGCRAPAAILYRHLSSLGRPKKNAIALLRLVVISFAPDGARAG